MELFAKEVNDEVDKVLNPVDIYLFKFNNGNTRTAFEMETPEQRVKYVQS